MHIKTIFKTIDNFINPDYVQTLDNNIDPYNVFENSVLTEEIFEIERNQKATMKLLKEYIYFKAVTDEGMLLTDRDKTQRAESFYNTLLDHNLIQRGLLVKWVLEEITNYVNQ